MQDNKIAVMRVYGTQEAEALKGCRGPSVPKPPFRISVTGTVFCYRSSIHVDASRHGKPDGKHRTCTLRRAKPGSRPFLTMAQ